MNNLEEIAVDLATKYLKEKNDGFYYKFLGLVLIDNDTYAVNFAWSQDKDFNTDGPITILINATTNQILK